MIPALSDLPAAPRRVILHWSGGGHRANATDLRVYHYVVEGDGTVREGRPVSLNMRQIEAGTPPTTYAAHTRGLNSFSVGISLAGMQGAQPGGTHGPAPLLAGQMDAAIQFVARCCEAWGLDPTRREHVLTHAEVQEVYGVTQANKWDITVLPWDPTVRGARGVGGWIRRHVAAAMEPPEPEPVVDVVPDSTRRPTPEPNVLPRMEALLNRPAGEAMTEFAREGETLREAECRLLDAQLRHRSDRLPVWLPASLARRVLARVIGCAE